ncbi:uncharacterized membrane protein YuzA (DUF378 family) [Saccharopolyspora hordei]|uniref:Uncharacterized membrane protein YuzA (DUF378 family) n=1 Tax=Saccharopolyspora hordei TaxID=1838 RepID=A0A853AKN6_9PSEU|nr:uncharacterized membrane protein YuzA (DUF378 family) [Saccharopolyspora hordei]
MTQVLLLLVLGGIALGGIGWTAWDICSDLRRRRL